MLLCESIHMNNSKMALLKPVAEIDNSGLEVTGKVAASSVVRVGSGNRF